MKRMILYSFVGLTLVSALLLRSGIVAVGISPYYHHKFNETETQIFENALLKLRERVENGKFDEIQNEIAEGRVSKSEIIGAIKKTRERFGKPLSSEFFRSSPPESVSKYYKNLVGTFYDVHYFTKTEQGEFFEDIKWVVSENNEVKFLNYGGSEILEWQIKNREIENYQKANYLNEIKIPFGKRFIEIKY